MRIAIIVFVLMIVCPCVNSYALYDQDYLIYDGESLTQVNCMRCNKPIKKIGKVYITLENKDIVYVLRLKELPNFVRVPITLADGSYTNFMMDKGCADEFRMRPSEKAGIRSQIKKGWNLEADAVNLPQARKDEINAKQVTVTGRYRRPGKGKQIKKYKFKEKDKFKKGQKRK